MDGGSCKSLHRDPCRSLHEDLCKWLRWGLCKPLHWAPCKPLHADPCAASPEDLAWGPRPSPSPPASNNPPRSKRDRSGGTAPRTRLHPLSVAAFLTLGSFRRGFGCFRHRAVALGSFRPRSAPAAPPCSAPQGAVRRGLSSTAPDWSWAAINPAPLRAASAHVTEHSSALSLA